MIWASQRKKNTTWKIARLQTHFFCKFVFCSRSSPDLGNNVWFGSRLPPARGLLSNLQSLVVLLHASALPTFFCLCKIWSFGILWNFCIANCVWGGVRATIHFTAGARPIRRLQLLWLTRKIHLFHAGKRTASPSGTDWVCLQALLHSLDILRLLAMACRRLAVSMICLIALWSLMKELDKPFNRAMEVMSEMFMDVSQSHTRHAHTGSDGCQKCLATATQNYSFSQDRLVLPLELLHWQGYPSTLKVPFNVSQNDLRDFAGEGMFLPSLATVIWSIFRIVDFSGRLAREMAMESMEEDSQAIASWVWRLYWQL